MSINKVQSLLLFLLLILINQVCKGQISVDSISYQHDLAIFKHALETTHPSLYRFTSKAQYDTVLDSLESNISDQTTELEFFRAISRVSSLVREGHTFVRPSESLAGSLKDNRLFPFGVQVTDDQLLIRNSRSPQLKHLENSSITSINGRSVKSILKALGESASTVSAFNSSGLSSRLSLYHNFALAYYYFIDTTSTFKIAYHPRQSAKIETLEVKGSANALSKLTYPELPPGSNPPFQLTFDENQSNATMRISTFAYWVVNKKISHYTRFFKESFEIIRRKKIKNLIIDVRGNRGGEEMIAGELLTYLIDKNFQIYRYCKAKTLDFTFTNGLPKASKTKLPSHNYISTDSGYYMKKANFLKTYVSKKLPFDGHTYVLSDGLCASANNIFLALIKTHQAGTIIGQESGGAFEDVDGRQRLQFTLPYSKIFVSYPVWSMKLNTKNGDPLRGVVPDHIIQHGQNDILHEVDHEMKFTLDLIQSNGQ